MRKMIREDIRASSGGRAIGPHLFPAGLAVILHRVAHELSCRRYRRLAAVIAASNEFITGVDIDPRASIGAGFRIVHTAGVVVGEIFVGNGLTIYSGVTLGAVGEHRAGFPHIGNHVMIGTKASLLGPIVIGESANIGAHCLVVRDVPAGARIRAITS